MLVYQILPVPSLFTLVAGMPFALAKNYILLIAKQKGINMTLNSVSKNSSQTLYNSEKETFMYKESRVKIITVFDDSIALVEDENGEVFEVPKEALR